MESANCDNNNHGWCTDRFCECWCHNKKLQSFLDSKGLETINITDNMAESKRKHLSREQILQVGKLYMKGKGFSEISEELNIDKALVRSAIYSLSKHGVEFPEHKRETSSKYAELAKEFSSPKSAK